MTSSKLVVQGASSQALASSDAFDKRAIVNRLSTMIERTVLSMDREGLRRFQTFDDFTGLAEVAKLVLENSPLPSDRRNRMEVKGRQRFRQLLQESGGVLSTLEVAEQLGKSKDAVLKDVKRHNLIALKGSDGSRSFPTFQFVAGEGKALAGWSEVLKALPQGLSPEGAIRFLLTPTGLLNSPEKTPLRLVQEGNWQGAVKLAETYMVQH